jgi:hypothetical protein
MDQKVRMKARKWTKKCAWGRADMQFSSGNSGVFGPHKSPPPPTGGVDGPVAFGSRRLPIPRPRKKSQVGGVVVAGVCGRVVAVLQERSALTTREAQRLSRHRPTSIPPPAQHTRRNGASVRRTAPASANGIGAWLSRATGGRQSSYEPPARAITSRLASVCSP